MAYKPYPIFDMKAGKVLAREPWLLPEDAFETLSNCHLKRGVLEKRQGRTLFGQIVGINTATKVPAMKTNPVMGILNYLSGATKNLVVFDKERMNTFVSSASIGIAITAFADATGGEVTATAASHGFETDDIVTIIDSTNFDGTYNITKINGSSFKFTDTWVSTPGETGVASQEKFLDATQNKIRYVGKTGQNWTPGNGDTVKGATSGATAVVDVLIVDYGSIGDDDANGTIIFQKGTVTDPFQNNEELQENGTPSNIAGQSQGANSDDLFTGDSTNFFWTENWNNVMYITTGTGTVQKYNGTNLARFSMDTGTDAARAGINDVTAVKLIFIVKNRIVAFNITDLDGAGPQRARWSGVGTPYSWPTDNFKDAPTSDVIISGDFIGDDLYIWFERSVWRFAYTGDSDDPFEWERVSDVDGVISTMGVVTVPAQNRQIAIGPNQILGNNGRQVVGVDIKIADFFLDQTIESLPYSYSLIVEEERVVYMTYTDANASAHSDGNIYPNRILIYNYEEDSWSTYSHPVHCLGVSTLESDRTWNISDTWEDTDYSWNARTAQAGFPTTLMGNHGGKIYQLNVGGADDGSDIEFSAIGGRWNPYIEQGKKAHLGYIDFLVDVDSDVTFDVLSFINTSSSAFQTKTITATAVDSGEDKAWHRVKINAVGRFHRIKITNSASANRPRIHAIVPHFRPAGGRLIG